MVRKTHKKVNVVTVAVALLVVLVASTVTAFLIAGSKGSKPRKTTTVTQEQTTAPVDTTPVKIQFAGDVLLHESTTSRAKSGSGYDFSSYFSEVDKYIDCDLGLVDIEGCVDYKGGNKSLAYYPFFNVPQEIVPALKNIGFTTVVTANNHSWDYGFEGMKGTVRTIEQAGLEQIGNYLSKEDSEKLFIKEINGIKVGVLAWTDSTNGNYMPDEYSSFCTKRFSSSDANSAKPILAEVKALREAGAEFIICALHWGVEYQDQPGGAQGEIAQALIDGGVDLIVGNHPHCLQPIHAVDTTRNGKPVKRYVFYACGNFIADQIVLDKPGLKTQQSVLGTLVISRDATTGEVGIDSIDYLPLVTHAYFTNGVKSTYKVLPLQKLAKEPIPCAYASSDYFKSSFSRVHKLCGDDIPLTKLKD